VEEQIRAGFVQTTKDLAAASMERSHRLKRALEEIARLKGAVGVGTERVIELEGHLETVRVTMLALENEMHARDAEKSALQKDTAARIDELQATADALAQQHTAETAHTATCAQEELDRVMRNCRMEAVKQVEQTGSAGCARLEEVKAEHERALEGVRAEHERALEEVGVEHERALETARTQETARLEVAQAGELTRHAEYEKEVVQREVQLQLRVVNAEAELAEAKTAHEEVVEGMAVACSAEVDRHVEEARQAREVSDTAGRQHSEALDAARTQAVFQAGKDEHSARVDARVAAEHATALEALEARLEGVAASAMEAAQAMAEVEMERLTAEMAAELTAQAANAAAMEAERAALTQANHAQEISEMRALKEEHAAAAALRHVERISDLESAHATAMEAAAALAQANHAQDLSDIESAHAFAQARVAESQAQDNEHEIAELESRVAEFQAQAADYEHEIAELTEAHAAASARVDVLESLNTVTVPDDVGRKRKRRVLHNCK
jgi:hypothetical protein